MPAAFFRSITVGMPNERASWRSAIVPERMAMWGPTPSNGTSTTAMRIDAMSSTWRAALIQWFSGSGER